MEASPGSRPPGKKAATFGPPLGTQKPDPERFTKAHEHTPPLSPSAPPTQPNVHLKPALPGRDDAPLMGLVSTKNYVLANAVETMLAPARLPPPPPPPATAKADFGKVPSYLTGVKARLAADKAAAAALEEAEAAAAVAATGLRELSQQERSELQGRLQEKWAAVNAGYCRLPLVCDTDPKKRRKEAFEAELLQLERDMETLGRPGPLLVHQENTTP